MLRLTMASIVWAAVASAAMAGLISHQENVPPFGDELPTDSLVRLLQAPGGGASDAPAEKKGGFVITDKTEVHLDGRPCRYAEIPPGAEIVLLEVAADGKTVMKVHFRTGK